MSVKGSLTELKIKKNTLKILIVGAKWYIMNDI